DIDCSAAGTNAAAVPAAGGAVAGAAGVPGAGVGVGVGAGVGGGAALAAGTLLAVPGTPAGAPPVELSSECSVVRAVGVFGSYTSWVSSLVPRSYSTCTLART